MYPPQTSLIPASVALLRFYQENGLSSFFVDYPYWYLGTTPFRYLIGPVLPLLLSSFSKNLPLFDSTILLVLFSIILCAFGWGVLVKNVTGSKHMAFLTFFILLVLPSKYITGLGIDEASFTLARAFLPFILLSVWQRKLIITCVLATLALLTNSSVLPQIVIGVVSCFLVKRITKKELLISLLSPTILATFWYGPSYWLTTLFNPSIGGLTGLRLLTRILDLARGILPIFLAFWVVRMGKVKRKRFEKFLFIYLGSFIFIFIYRFLADPDFWLDWAVYLPDLETAALLLLIHKRQQPNISYRIGLIFAAILAVNLYVFLKIPDQKLILTKPVEYKQALEKLAIEAGNNRVFISGSSVFWLNSFSDTKQVRGGRDQFAIHPTWSQNAFILRESKNRNELLNAINELGIDYLLVHTEKSHEFFKDFKNAAIWELIGLEVSETEGDIIYKVK